MSAIVSSSKVIQAVFIIPPEVQLLDITGPAHIFYEVSCYGMPVNLIYSSISAHSRAETSAAQLVITDLQPFDQLELMAGDIIFIPGLSASIIFTQKFMDSTRPFQSWLKKQHVRGVIIASVCTGAFIVAESGLLNAKSCTTHWKYFDQFKRQYPKTKVLTNRLFVCEDNIYTSAGVTSGIDLSLYLVERLWGPGFAAQIAKEVVIYHRRTVNDPQLSVFTQYRNHIDQRIHIVQDRLAQSLGQKIIIEELAREVNMSRRNLTRLFKKTSGITIGNYLDNLRFDTASNLLRNGSSVKAAALQCGFKSTNQLRNMMRRIESMPVLL